MVRDVGSGSLNIVQSRLGWRQSLGGGEDGEHGARRLVAEAHSPAAASF